MRAAGLRSLAVCYPRQVRGNDYFRQRYPEVVRAAEERGVINAWQDPALEEGGGGGARTRGLFEREMARYLQDPFRGSVSRRVLGPGQTALSLEVPVAQAALAAAGVPPDEVDLLIAVSFLPDQLDVGNAAFLARDLGLTGAAWNLESACSGGLVALQTACGLVSAGQHEKVLVVVSCTYSQTMDEADSLAWFVGDGAGAFLVTVAPAGSGLLGGRTLNTAASCGAMRCDVVESPGRGPWRRMQTTPQGGRLLRQVSDEFVRRCCLGALEAAGVGLEEIALLVCNTPVAWNAAFCCKALGLDPGRAVDTYPLYGNIGPALLTANLYHGAHAGRLRPGDLVLLYTIGAVSSASAAVLRWGDVALAEREISG